MSEMLTRVGAAILEAESRWTPKSTESKERVMALAAIEAMRAPGDGFASYLELAHGLRPQEWSDLIDAALTEAASPPVPDKPLSPV